MRKVQIDSGPPPASYDSAAEAIAAAKNHPSQDRARRFAKLLQGSHILRGSWTTGNCELSFSNGCALQVEAREFQVHWRVRDADDRESFTPFEPVRLVWSSDIDGIFDPDFLVSAISGALFTNLFVNDWGLYLYTRGNPILMFHAVRDRESECDFLYADLED